MAPKKNHILIIGTVWPEPDSSAAGSRMLQLIRLFRSQDWDVTFASSAAESEFSADLTDLGIEKKSIELNSSSFDEFIQHLSPSVVLFDRFMTEEQFGWRIAEHCTSAIRILDTVDLHCLRKAREIAWKENREFQPEHLLSTDLAKREVASVYRCDLSLVISEFEMCLLTNLFSIDDSLLVYTPFLFNPIIDSVFSGLPVYEEREHFITIGNFLHEPNWNSVLWLKEEIWPLIREKLPNVELHIYGAYPSQKVFQLHKEQDGFLIKGRAISVEDVVSRSRVLLTPLRFGAGLKGKLTDAMRFGTPSVTTPVGAEGINGNLPWPGFIENSGKKIAESAVELYQSGVIWAEAQNRGKEIINHRFSAQTHGTELIEMIKKCSEELENHRRRNFIGSLLMHHFHASTKFMSRWIEEKNREK